MTEESLRSNLAKIERLATLYRERGRTADVVKCYEKICSSAEYSGIVSRNRMVAMYSVMFDHYCTEKVADQLISVCERWARLLYSERKTTDAAQLVSRVPADLIDPSRHGSFVEMKKRLLEIETRRSSSKREQTQQQNKKKKYEEREEVEEPGMPQKDKTAAVTAKKGEAEQSSPSKKSSAPAPAPPPAPAPTPTPPASAAPAKIESNATAANNDGNDINKAQKLFTLGVKYAQRERYEEAKERIETVLENFDVEQLPNEIMITALQTLLKCYQLMGKKVTNQSMRILRVSTMLAERLLQETSPSRTEDAARLLTGLEDIATDLDDAEYWTLLEKVQERQIKEQEEAGSVDDHEFERELVRNEQQQQQQQRQQKTLKTVNVEDLNNTNPSRSNSYVPNVPNESDVDAEKCGKLFRLAQLQFEKEKFDGALISCERLALNYRHLLNQIQWSNCMDNILFIVSQTDVITDEEDKARRTLYYLHLMISTVYMPNKRYTEADIILSNFSSLAREKDDVQVLEMYADVKAHCGKFEAAILLFGKCCSICEQRQDFRHACTVYRKMHNITAILQQQQQQKQQQQMKEMAAASVENKNVVDKSDPEIAPVPPGMPHAQVVDLFKIHEVKWNITRDNLRKVPVNKQPLQQRVKLGDRIFDLVMSREKSGFTFSIESQALKDVIFYAEFRIFVNGSVVTDGWQRWNLRAEGSTQFFDGKRVSKLDRNDCELVIQMRFGFVYKPIEDHDHNMLDDLDELADGSDNDDDDNDVLAELNDLADDGFSSDNDLLMDLKEPETEAVRHDRMISEIILNLAKRMSPQDELALNSRVMELNRMLDGSTPLSDQQEMRVHDTIALLDNFISCLSTQ